MLIREQCWSLVGQQSSRSEPRCLFLPHLARLTVEQKILLVSVAPGDVARFRLAAEVPSLEMAAEVPVL